MNKARLSVRTIRPAFLLLALLINISSAQADVVLRQRSEDTGVSLLGGPVCSTKTDPVVHVCSDWFPGALGAKWEMFHRGDYVTLTGRGYFRIRWEWAWFNRPGQLVMPTFTDQKGTFLHVGDAEYAGEAQAMDASWSYGKRFFGQVNFTAPSTYAFAFQSVPPGAAMPWQNQYFYLDGSITIHQNERGADYNIGITPVSYNGVLSDLNTPVGAWSSVVRQGVSYDPESTVPPPQAATGLSAHAVATSAELSWKPCGGQVTGTQVEYSNNAPTEDDKGIMYKLASSTNGQTSTYTMGSLAPGSYTFRTRCYNAAGYSDYSNTAQLVVPPTGKLPASLRSADIGINPKAATNDPSFGVAGFDGLLKGVYQIGGSGHDISNHVDHFHFTSMPMKGNGTITARVIDLNYTHPWAKAGVMIRETLDPGASNAVAVATPGNGLAYQYRGAQGGGTSTRARVPGHTPYWLRVTRAGSVFTAYYSLDGDRWTQMGVAAISMRETVYFGLAVSGTQTYPNLQPVNRYNDFKGYATAAFDHVAITQ